MTGGFLLFPRTTILYLRYSFNPENESLMTQFQAEIFLKGNRIYQTFEVTFIPRSPVIQAIESLIPSWSHSFIFFPPYFFFKIL